MARSSAMARREQDSFGRRAKREGFPARSVYKLEEIDARFRILREGQKVLDLGCHPGSWMIYAAKKVGQKGLALGIDLKETPAPTAWSKTLVADIFQVSPEELLAEYGPFDVV